MGVLIFLCLALQQAPSPCSDAASCRAGAERAAAAGDFETFHDLAWRAVQKSKPNDAASMFLLARAQSLSGRPDDAIVMLGRLVDMHAPIDLALPDFERARRLPAWAALMAKVSPSAGSEAVPSASAMVDPVAPKPASAAPSKLTTGVAAPSAPDPGEVTEFEPPANLGAFAIAHDAVSRRFVIGDAPSRRLLIVDQVSKHVVPYVSAASAGFFDALTALTIDARRGDLWVASARGSGAAAESVVHKLQLVSGRGLMEAHPADSLRGVRIVDLVVVPDGTVFALDAAGGRILRLRPGARTLDVALRIDVPNPSALAAVDDRVLYVASDRGLMRVDASARAVQAVKSVEDLSGFTSLAWHNGALYGVQRASGASLAVRIALDSAGTRAQPRAILAAAAEPIVGTVTDGAFYYLLLGAIHRLPTR
jgi:hypothetical protein